MVERGGHRRFGPFAAAFGGWLVLGVGAAAVEARPAPLAPDDPVTADEFDLPADATGVVEVGTGPGTSPTVSGDGRFVAFEGPPAGAPADTERTTIWLTDRELGTTLDLVAQPDSARPGSAVNPVLSADSCSVTMITEIALDMFRDDDSGSRWDVYRQVLPHCGGTLGDWELVSVRTPTPVTARNDIVPTDPPAVSRSGTVVAYTHTADHLATDGLRAVSVVDLTIAINAPGRSVVAAGLPANAPDTVFHHSGMDQPALSGDGRYLAYRSDAAADEAVPRWGEGAEAGDSATPQVYVWDRQQPDRFDAVMLASSSFDGEPSTRGAGDPVLSRDGSVLAFVSTDTGLVGLPGPVCDELCSTHVFHLDRDSDGDGALDESGAVELRLVSSEPQSDPPVPGTASSMQPALTADGDTVVFVTKATNLKRVTAGVGGDPETGDLMRWSAADGGLDRVVPAQDITARVGTYARPSVDDIGRTTVFDALPIGGTDVRVVRAMLSPPRLALADLDMGSTIVGQTSDEWYVAVINDGPSAFEPAVVTVSDEHFTLDEDESSCLSGAAVPPGGDCVLRLTFTPSEPGRVSGTLQVSETGFRAMAVESQLSGAGGEPTLGIQPAGADIGVVDIGTDSDRFYFDVENTSVLATRIAGIEVAGADPGDFAVVEQNCLDRPFNPKAACSVGVVFTPTAEGRRTALVEVRTEDDTYATFLVSGDGEFAPRVALSTDSVIAGDSVGVVGSGYPADTQLRVRFADAGGLLATATTNAEGGFLVDVPVGRNERTGTRRLIVESVTGVVGAMPVEVLDAGLQLVGLPGFGLGR